MEITPTDDGDPARMESNDETDATAETELLSNVDIPPAVELVGETRQMEARLAVATAAGLVERGVSPSDVVITTVDGDRYEDALRRAATRYGLTLAVWTQLRLKRTVPYQLIVATLDVLIHQEQGTGPIDVATLAEPLRLGWISTVNEFEPLSPEGVDTVTRAHAGRERSLSEWKTTIDHSDLPSTAKGHWMAYLNWLTAQSKSPSSRDMADTLDSVLEAFDDRALPERPGDAAVSELAETHRGFERTDKLVQMTQKRYARWLSEGRTDQEWQCIRELLESFASTVPGHRELPTAAAVDVMEANDTWALEVPYVIAVGLVEGEWPPMTDSLVPSAAQTRLAYTDTQALDGLRPHSTWTTARDRDHASSAVSTATELLITTRYATDADSVEKRPSRFLEAIAPTGVAADAQQALIADPTALPNPIIDQLSSSYAT